MSGIARGTQDRQGTGPWQQRVDSADWQAVATELDAYGGALLPQLLTVFHDAP
jgi:hypothetical protein